MSQLPSCLTMVNRVLEECGDLTVASLNPGTRNSKIALEGMNDAQSEIWKRQRWPWQRQTYNLSLVAGQGDYALPDRFDRLAEPLNLGAVGSFQNLKEFTDEEWNQLNMGVPATDGTPRGFKISNVTMTMTPAPSAEFVALYPQLIFTYFQAMPNRRGVTDDNNSWDVPGSFYDEMISYGKSKLKQYLGFPDWQVDMGTFEQGMRSQLNKVREGRAPAKMRPTNWVVSTW